MTPRCLVSHISRSFVGQDGSRIVMGILGLNGIVVHLWCHWKGGEVLHSDGLLDGPWSDLRIQWLH